MTFYEAALTVLGEAGRPLDSAEIVEQILTRRLVPHWGRTPVATLNAALYRHAKNSQSRIVRVAEPGQRRAVRASVRWTLRGH